MNYELGSMDSMINMSDHRTIARLNGSAGGTLYENHAHTYDSSSIQTASKALAAAAAAGMTASSTSTTDETQDILPSRDDEVKRWSCDMDSNILF